MAKKLGLIGALAIFIAGIVFTGLFNVGLSATNEMEFCTSCHSMKVNLEEYKETVHYKNTSGVRATCSDCHVPKPFVPKMVAKVLAAKDVYHEVMGTIDTEEKYEAYRWQMATSVWQKMKASNSRECRTCHNFDQMAFDDQGRMARKKHSAAADRGETCIDCHKGIAHEEPDEPDGWDEETAGEHFTVTIANWFADIDN
ncbi:MAG: NapC/NirT family cytochrome c [Chromatiales bacterium]|jgi:cytochrome c-type protein NapC